MTQSLWPQVLQSHCAPVTRPLGSTDPSVLIGAQQQQVKDLQAYFQQLSEQTNQGLEALSNLSQSLSDLSADTSDADVTGTLSCLEQKLADVECEVARLHGRLGSAEGQLVAIQVDLTAQQNAVGQWQRALDTKAAQADLVATQEKLDAAIAGWQNWRVWWPRLQPLALEGVPHTPYTQVLKGCKIGSLQALAKQRPATLLRSINGYGDTVKLIGRQIEKAEVEEMIQLAADAANTPTQA
jgi:hypothetical protein